MFLSIKPRNDKNISPSKLAPVSHPLGNGTEGEQISDWISFNPPSGHSLKITIEFVKFPAPSCPCSLGLSSPPNKTYMNRKAQNSRYLNG